MYSLKYKMNVHKTNKYHLECKYIIHNIYSRLDSCIINDEMTQGIEDGITQF
jgi:hypothetical protein